MAACRFGFYNGCCRKAVFSGVTPGGFRAGAVVWLFSHPCRNRCAPGDWDYILAVCRCRRCGWEMQGGFSAGTRGRPFSGRCRTAVLRVTWLCSMQVYPCCRGWYAGVLPGPGCVPGGFKTPSILLFSATGTVVLPVGRGHGGIRRGPGPGCGLVLAYRFGAWYGQKNSPPQRGTLSDPHGVKGLLKHT